MTCIQSSIPPRSSARLKASHVSDPSNPPAAFWLPVPRRLPSLDRGAGLQLAQPAKPARSVNARSIVDDQPARPAQSEDPEPRPQTINWDLWIDLGLVLLPGGASLVLLKLVECFCLTDAIVGHF